MNRKIILIRLGLSVSATGAPFSWTAIHELGLWTFYIGLWAWKEKFSAETWFMILLYLDYNTLISIVNAFGAKIWGVIIV